MFSLETEVSLIVAIDGAGCHDESKLGYFGLFIWVPFAIYLMVGQFVICEEYFVPILSQLGDRWNMAEDAQGATLLAIGSSSPELFTAVLGAMLLPDDNPGPGTNVGSAVFNMCIIIGLSAIFAPRVVKLQLIPFLRDSICYMLGLAELYVFYSVTSPGYMDIYEALALVGWWALYVFIVVRTDLLAVRCCCCIPADDRERTVSEIEMNDQHKNNKESKRDPLLDGSREKELLSGGQVGSGNTNYVALGGNEADNVEISGALQRNSYRRAKSVVKQSQGKRGVLYDNRGYPVADMDQNPDNIRIAPGAIPEHEVDEELQRLLDELNRKQRQNINAGWMVVVVPRKGGGGGGGGDQNRLNPNGMGGGQPRTSAYVRRRTLMETIVHEQSKIQQRKQTGHPHHSSGGGGGHGGGHGHDDHGHDDEHGHGGGILHKILIPWVIIFGKTLPRPEGAWASSHIYTTIAMIVAWLGILTFFVVDAASKIGECFFIPADLLGVTLLAVGSSLPDCISSVIVARQMKIDAAVANAFGSNIFDANLAVGFSFTLSSITAIMHGEESAISLGSEEATHTFMLLILTAAAYLVILWLMMWCTLFRLERWMGFVLITLYVVFVVVFTILFSQAGLEEEILELEGGTTLLPLDDIGLI